MSVDWQSAIRNSNFEIHITAVTLSVGGYGMAREAEMQTADVASEKSAN